MPQTKSRSREEADRWRIEEYRERAALKLTDAIVEVGQVAGLTSEQILASLDDETVRRAAERSLNMKRRSDATWAHVARFTAVTLRGRR